MAKCIDLTGQKFGRLTVVKKNGCQNGHILWDCDCECGNTITVKGIHLKSGHTQSCGCYKKSQISKTQTMARWADELEISDNTLLMRLRRGWSVEEALTTKVKG